MGARGSFKGLFNPVQLGVISAWLRVPLATVTGSGISSLPDVLNPSAPAVQTVEGRRPAVGSSANGLPVMVFGGDDVLAWPTTAAISNTTTQGYWFWIRYAGSGIQQRIFEMRAVVGGGTPHRLSITISTTGTLLCDVYITNSDGRRFTTSLTLTVGQWYAIYWQYDSSRGGDANLALYVDGVSVSLTPSNIGAGGTLGALRAFAGDALIGAGQNQDSPSGALANGSEVGPNLYAFNANLTAAQILALMNFERPTV